jgi:ACR3 family arsenite transporter
MFLCGVANIVVPRKVLITAGVVFIVILLAVGWLTRTQLIKSHGRDWFANKFLPKFHPVTIFALFLTLVLIFAFQAGNLTTRWLAVLLLAVPIMIQVYFNSSLAYLLMRRLRVPHDAACPGALIGASNFFEVAVAVAITFFGPASGAALATVVGVLVEVPWCCRSAKSAMRRAGGIKTASRANRPRAPCPAKPPATKPFEKSSGGCGPAQSTVTTP